MATTRTITRLTGTVARAGLALGLAATASLPAVAGNIGKLRTTATYRDAVFAAAQNTPAWVNDRCAEAVAQLPDEFGVVTTPEVDDEGKAQGGAWIEHVRVEGCGRQRQLNVLVRVRMPGTIAMAPLLPGTTRANPKLQDDGSTYAFVAAALDPKGCTPTYIADTTYVGTLDGGSKIPGKPAWSEIWTIAQCKTRTEVKLVFVPDETGTTVTATRNR